MRDHKLSDEGNILLRHNCDARVMIVIVDYFVPT